MATDRSSGSRRRVCHQRARSRILACWGSWFSGVTREDVCAPAVAQQMIADVDVRSGQYVSLCDPGPRRAVLWLCSGQPGT